MRILTEVRIYIRVFVYHRLGAGPMGKRIVFLLLFMGILPFLIASSLSAQDRLSLLFLFWRPAISGKESGPSLFPQNGGWQTGGAQRFPGESPWSVSFWASWCSSCKEDIPLIEKFAQGKKDHVTIFTVAIDGENEKRIQRIIKEYKITFARLSGREGEDRQDLWHPDGSDDLLNQSGRNDGGYDRGSKGLVLPRSLVRDEGTFRPSLTKDSSSWNPSCLNSNDWIHGSLIRPVSLLSSEDPMPGNRPFSTPSWERRLPSSLKSPRPRGTVFSASGTWKGGQLIFLDTPGIHQGKSKLNQRMVSTAIESGWDVDVRLFLIDASSPHLDEDRKMVGSLEGGRGVPFLVINKIDLVKKETLLPLMDQYRRLHPFEALLPVSALTGEGVPLLLEEILKVLPESPPYYPEDMITDQTERFLVSEIIREKVIQHSYQEIPFATAVTIEAFKEQAEKNLVVIRGIIHVERDSQKKIVIGKGGQKLKKIGESARKEIEAFLGKKVFLELWVRQEKNWTQDPGPWMNWDIPPKAEDEQRVTLEP